MRLFVNRPLATWCFTAVLFSFILFFLPLVWKLAGASLALVAFCILFVQKRGYARIFLCGMMLTLLLSSLLSVLSCDVFQKKVLAYDGQTVELVGEVIDVRGGEGRDYYTMRTTTFDQTPVRTNITFSAEKGAFLVGDVLSCSAHLADSKNGDGLLSYYSYGQRIFLTATTENETVLSHRDTLGTFFTACRARVADVFRETIGGDAGAFASGLLIGERSEISDVIERDCKRCGITHILSVSGMHLSLLFAMLVISLRTILPWRRVRYPILCAFTFFFVGLVGLQAAVLRSAVMAILAITAELCGRKSDSVTNLAVAAAALLLYRPTVFLDVGYLLSCLATFGIVTLGLPLARMIASLPKEPVCIENCLTRHTGHRVRRFCIKYGFLAFRSATIALASGVVLTITATVFTLPVTAFCFASFPLLTIFANLILAPLSSLVLYLTIPTLLCGFFLPSVTCFAWGTRVCANLFLSLVSAWSALPGWSVVYKSPAFVPVLCIGVVTVLLVFLLAKRLRPVISVLLAFLVLATGVGIVPRLWVHSKITVAYLPHRNGDVLLLAQGGKTILLVPNEIDYARLTAGLSLAESVVYRDEIDLLLLPHPTKGTLKQLADICANYYIRELALGDATGIALDDKNGATVRVLSDDTITFAGITIRFAASGELVVLTDAHGFYYTPTAQVTPSAFYYAHREKLSAVFLGGDVYRQPSHVFSLPLIGSDDSGTPDISLAPDKPFFIRFSKEAVQSAV